MTDNGEPAFARWSRLKREHATKAAAGPQKGRAATRPASEAAAETTPGDRPAPPPAKNTASQLPDIASLTKDSDFTPFLGRDVPEEVHRQALRALWRTDPIFSLRDGLTDYGEDYTAIGKVEEVVRTAYRVGQGYLGEAVPEHCPEGVRPEPEPPMGDAAADGGAAQSDPSPPSDAADDASLLDIRERPSG